MPNEPPPASASESAQPTFYPVPLLKVLAFTALSGGLYLYYWMYRAWRAYRDAQGYSVSSFWKTVEARTGYRPSPFWRSLLWNYYVLALFPAIDRECRARDQKMPLPPILLAFGVTLSVVAGGMATWGPLLPALAMMPIQVAVNRLNKKEATNRWGMAPVEAGLTVLGVVLHWGNV